MTIVVNTPNGNIGRPLSEALLDAGERLVVIQRDPAKVADLAARGATVVAGSIDEAAVVDRAFEGARAVFWLTPPSFRPGYREWAVGAAASAAAAAKKHGVERAVLLSSVGAHNPGNGPVSILGEVEETFRAALPNVLALRPAYFFENFHREVGSIAAEGAWYGPVPAPRAMPMVATADIAAVAAEELRRRFSGHRTRGIHGPVDLSFGEVATIFSAVFERPVRYVEVPHAAAVEAMRKAGMPDFMVELYAEMLDGFITGRMDSAEPRSTETTTPTDLASFARAALRPALG